MYTAWDTEAAGPSHQQVAEFLAGYHGLELYTVFDVKDDEASAVKSFK